jgi:two-component system, NtrC family, C4-dicarboxylate transport response regulator DctD
LAREARSRYRRDIPEITPEMIVDLMAYDWPGNVRELRNIADRLVLGIWTGMDDGLSNGHDSKEGKALAADGSAINTLAERVSQYERTIIATELKQQSGSVKKTYEALGLSRKALYQKMKKYQLDKKMLLDDGDDNNDLD